MINHFTLVGRLANNPEVKTLGEDTKVTNVTLAIPRTYRNANGEYETDFVDLVLWKGIAENTSNYCHKGDIIAVRGSIQTRNITDKDGNIKKIQENVVEKVTFLTTKEYHNKDVER